MNGHRSLLVAVLVITLFVSALFWFSLPPANVYARSSSVRPMGSGSNAPEITFTSAFTVYLPLILNNFPPTNVSFVQPEAKTLKTGPKTQLCNKNPLTKLQCKS